MLAPVQVHVTVPPTATVTLDWEKKLSPMFTEADIGGGGEGWVVVVPGPVVVVVVVGF